jgi:hypothetical protein
MYTGCPGEDGVDGLCHHHEHAARHAHDDLLSRLRLVALFLDLVAGQRTAQRAQDHGHVAPRASADQAADAEARYSADDSAEAAMMVARHLRLRNLLDDATADFALPGLRHRRRANDQAQRQHGRRHERKQAFLHRTLLIRFEPTPDGP